MLDADEVSVQTDMCVMVEKDLRISSFNGVDSSSFAIGHRILFLEIHMEGIRKSLRVYDTTRGTGGESLISDNVVVPPRASVTRCSMSAWCPMTLHCANTTCRLGVLP